MNRNEILAKIKKAKELDDKRRTDIRYLRAMAFFVKKGFLRANADFTKYYLPKVRVQDAIWAGQMVEPRILEVLPAAVARLPRAFIFEGQKNNELREVAEALANKQEIGKDFFNIPYRKIRTWMFLQLKDQRTKTEQNKKMMKTFRFIPAVVEKLSQLKEATGNSETEIIEQLVLGADRYKGKKS